MAPQIIDSTETHRGRLVRDILVFVIGTYVLAIAGGLINLNTAELGYPGSLLFILSPLMMVLIVRVGLRAGWADAGLGLNLKAGWGWYLVALLTHPISFTAAAVVGIALGMTALKVPLSDLPTRVITGLAIQAVPRLLFALSEEWAWRGFLEPKLAALGMRDLQRHLVVGLIWGVWHFPLIMSTNYTEIPLLIYLPIFLAGALIFAVVFGQIRQRSGSVWPAVILHGMGNIIGFTMLDLMTFDNELLIGITPASVFVMVVWGIGAAWLIAARKASSSAASL